MSRKVITPAGALPGTNPLSPGIAVGGLVFVSGQTAPDAKGVEAQARAVLEKLGAVLRAAGSDYKHVARCGVYIKDVADFQTVNAVYREFFPTDPPARSTIVCQLVQTDILVEVDCVGMVPQR
jgi:reactive intermediate/imine deaminase